LDIISIGVGSKLGTPGISEKLKLLIKCHEKTGRFTPRKNEKFMAYTLPFISNSNFYAMPTSGKNWILVGDAAGHVNAINGEGIYYAMKGGKLAAKAVIEGEINAYEKYWRDAFGSDLYMAAKMGLGTKLVFL